MRPYNWKNTSTMYFMHIYSQTKYIKPYDPYAINLIILICSQPYGICSGREGWDCKLCLSHKSYKHILSSFYKIWWFKVEQFSSTTDFNLQIGIILLYKSKCPSVCPYIRMSVCPSTTFRGKRDILCPNLDRGLISSSFATYGCCHPC